jgi:arabinogalactan oligomer/maltooligosaccharide transport system substrate-binding protein
MSNRLKAAALTAVFALAIGAVPAMAQDAPAVPEVPASELAYQGEITFWNTMRDFEMAEVQKLIDAWSAAHPGITVTHSAQSFDTARQDFLNAAPAQTAPDILRADIGWTTGFADQGFLLDLTDLVDASDFLETPLATNMWQGRLFGVPHVTDALGLQCNKEILTSLGMDAAPATWGELVAKGAEFADLDAQQYGFYMRAGDSYWSHPFTWAWGGQLFSVNDDGSVDVLINGPESVAGWNFVRDQIVGQIMPATWDIPNEYTNMSESFKAGDMMCVMNGPWAVGDHLSGAAFTDPSNLVIAPIPTGPDGDTGSPVGGHNYVVYALVGEDPDRQGAVLDLLAYINGSEAQAFLATGPLGLLPTRPSAYENEAVAANPIIAAWVDVLELATNRAGHPAAGDIYVPLHREWQAFLIGDKTAEEALAAVEAEWETIFNG